MANTPNKSKDAPKDETLVTAPVLPGEDPNAELDPEGAAPFRVEVERPGDELEAPVAERGRAVDVADLAAAAAADHSPANRVIEYFFTIDHDKRSFV